MDTSTKYIEMCRQAKEIQELWRPQQGDFGCSSPYLIYTIGKSAGFLSAESLDGKWSSLVNTTNDVWLPRQDQLQEIVHSGSTYILLDRFHKNVFGNPNIPYDKDITMEQLWIAFVMDKKLNKKWNGSEWIKV